MNTEILRKIGLTDNEIKIYIFLLKKGLSTAYDISKETDIYRVHVYDKLEQLMNKGLVNHVLKGSKKHFQATHPSKINDYVEEKKRELVLQEREINSIMPELEAMTKLPREDTVVEVLKGKEGLKYFLKDCIKVKEDVIATGIDDEKFNEALPVYMKQFFRDMHKNNIHERIITVRKPDVFLYKKDTAKTTKYRFLEEKQFNPTNTFVYGNRVVIITWGTPLTAIMIKNEEIAKTYRYHFEHLWNIASEKI